MPAQVGDSSPGKKEDSTLIRKKIGLYRDDVEASKLSEHSTSFMIGNESTGQWMKRSPFDEPKGLGAVAWLFLACYQQNSTWLRAKRVISMPSRYPK